MPNQLQLLIGRDIPIQKLKDLIKEKRANRTLTSRELDLALRTAARIGTVEQLSEIITAGASLDASGLDRNLLDLALINPNSHVAQIASNRRDYFNDGSHHVYPLINTAIYQMADTKIVDEYMQLDSYIVHTPNQAGRTILFYAAAIGHEKMVGVLNKSDEVNPTNKVLTSRQLWISTMYQFGRFIHLLRGVPKFPDIWFKAVINKFDTLIDFIKNDTSLHEYEKKRELVKAYRQKASLYSIGGEYLLNHAQELVNSKLDNKEQCEEADDFCISAKQSFCEALDVLAKISAEYLTEVDRINNRKIAMFMRDNLYSAYYYQGLASYRMYELRVAQSDPNAKYGFDAGPIYFGIAMQNMMGHIEDIDNESLRVYLEKLKEIYANNSTAENEATVYAILSQLFDPNLKVPNDELLGMYVQLMSACEKCENRGTAGLIPTILTLIYLEFLNNKLPNSRLNACLQNEDNLNRLLEVIKKHNPKFEGKKSPKDDAKQLKDANDRLEQRNKALEEQNVKLQRKLTLLQESLQTIENTAKLSSALVREPVPDLKDQSPTSTYPAFLSPVPRLG